MDKTPLRCIYSPERRWIVDYVRADESDVAAIARLSGQYGEGLVALEEDAAHARLEDDCRTEPEEITSREYDEMLNILQPVGWTDGMSASFKVSEPITGSVHPIYVKIIDRFFTFQDNVRMPHHEVCAKVMASEAYHRPKGQALKERSWEPER